MDAAMWYIKDNGIALDSKYPYKGDEQKCAYNTSMQIYTIKDCAEVPKNSPKYLMSAIVKQPVSIAVEADGLYFQLYKSGVYNRKCGTDLDHGMLLTGYGVSSKK